MRKARLSDFEDVYQMLCYLWPQEKISKRKAKSIYQRLLRKKDQLMYVMETDRIIGYFRVSVYDDFQIQDRIGYLAELVLDPSETGKGYGKKLLKESMRVAKKAGAKELQFPTTKKRKAARTLYEKLGFKNTGFFYWREL